MAGPCCDGHVARVCYGLYALRCRNTRGGGEHNATQYDGTIVHYSAAVLLPHALVHFSSMSFICAAFPRAWVTQLK